jgi:cell wall-associated NlpC family hydrolase
MRMRRFALSATLVVTSGLLVCAVPGAQRAEADPTPVATDSASASVTVGQESAVVAAAASTLTVATAAQPAARSVPIGLAVSRTVSPTEVKAGKVVKAALSRVATGQYVWGASGSTSFDCSGLMIYAYRQIGVSLPHSSAVQSTLGKAVSVKNLKPGDLLFFYSPVHHVGMYIGHGRFVHARNPTNDLEVDSLSAYGHFTTARRILGG